DGNAGLPHFAFGSRVIRVVAHQRREVECRRQPRLTMREKKLEALVRVARAPEAGELSHRPEPAAVSRGMNAARVRIFAWHADVRRARPGYVQRRVERIDFAFRIHETDIAELSRGVAAPPLGD